MLTKATSMLIATLFAVGGAQAAMQATALPPLHTRGDIAWLSGGIGAAEAHAIERAARHYPLSLEFVIRSPQKGLRAEFAANVPVTIQDMRGKEVFSAESQGPFMLLRLPEGRYVVRAEVHGKKFERHVVVGHQPRRVVFEALS